MATTAIYRLVEVGLLQIAIWYKLSRLASKFAVAACVAVAPVAIYAGVVISDNIRDNALQEAATRAALYMDSFVASHVQELATAESLSAESRVALAARLSPASMHRPVVAFRIWKADTIAFANEPDLIGKKYKLNSARERALQGHIGVEFEHPDGDDDEVVRELKVPILEIYAPVRQKGTGRIIAIAETYEIGIELKREIWLDQAKAWVSVAAAAFVVILVILGIAGVGQRESKALLGQIAERERKFRKMATANMEVSEINEHTLRQVERNLQHGPAQKVSLALFKLDPVYWTFCKSDGVVLRNATQRIEDIEAVRKALTETARDIKEMCSIAVPNRVAELSPGDTLTWAACEHYRRTGQKVEYDFGNLPDQLPAQLKACLYRIILEALQAMGSANESHQNPLLHEQQLCQSADCWASPCNEGRIEVVSLRHRLEALGGTVDVQPESNGQVSLAVELDLSHMGLIHG